ncbi:hypothetical protein BU25DRAFT_448143 [Macroventuria anomochaeta]|uniref:Uncharacterized protein n=1 Tax=Macroventuria anomochaeta TaxID=301207 RepID=A0ACB6S4P1_9PLEO|nr:uncharacterized protein BU25DRAFT_448143 [Macroventuria anomochaeta]KAF2628179.1 hypothetical protein BU25DRAFT_448143 [Macroventuria anomochaeta]
MTMNGDVEAKKLGEKLLLDVKVEELSSILGSLRELGSENERNEATTNKVLFSIPELDALISSSSPTILELVSPPPTHHPSGAGKTSLLYLIIAHAILPPTFNSITDLHGHDAAIIIFDPLHHFSVPRLASVMLNLIVSKFGAPVDALDPSIKADLLNLTTRCLDHVHVFRLQSWDSLITTLHSVPDYLFDETRHKSTHRRIHSLVLEDIDAFTWSLRSAHSTSSSSSSSNNNINPLSAASKALTTEIKNLATLLSCNIILTSPSILPTAFRPALPTSWPSGMHVTRLAVRRVEVLKFAPEMGVEQAEAERSQRWEVVRRGQFECWKVGTGVRDGEGEGFVFKVGPHGVEVAREGGG